MSLSPTVIQSLSNFVLGAVQILHIHFGAEGGGGGEGWVMKTTYYNVQQGVRGSGGDVLHN